MLKIIREILLKIVNDIDTGNSNLSPEECEEVIEYLSGITNKNEKLSKYQACKYLKVSRATFDNYVKAKKIPNGRKQIGFKELFWYKKDFHCSYWIDNICWRISKYIWSWKRSFSNAY